MDMKTFLVLMLSLFSLAENSLHAQERTLGGFFTNVAPKVKIDSDAYSFVTRAGVSDLLTIGAVDQLVTSLKANNLWSNFYGLYPFVGGTSNSTRQNLAGTNYNILWGSNFVYSTMGVSNAGISINGGDTGFVFTNFSGVDFHMYAWVATNGVLFGGTVIGVFDGMTNAVSVLTIRPTSFYVQCEEQDGEEGPSGVASGPNVGGNMIAQRVNGLSSLTTSLGSPTWYGPGPGDPCNSPNTEGATLKVGYVESVASHATLRAASFGKGLTPSQVQTYFAIMNRFQQALGRGNP